MDIQENNTPQDKKLRLINIGKTIEFLSENEGFIYLLEELDEKAQAAKDALEHSTSWDDFSEKRGYLRGISALKVEITTIISRYKSAERTLK